MSMIDLSIVIVSWNAKTFLQKCIISIIKEGINFNLQIIVVDNASTDGSPEMVDKLFPKVELIRNEKNLGFAKANNIGINECNGRYICLINSDVEVLPRCFDELITYITKHSDIGLLGPKIINPNGSLQRSCKGYATPWNMFCRALALDTLFPAIKLFGGRMLTYWNHDTTQEVDVVNGCFWVVNKAALDKVGLLDENFFIYAEDVDWCKRFTLAGWKVIYFTGAQAIHYGGASSDNSPIRFYLEMQKANFLYWKKHHTHLAQMSFLMISGLHHLIRYLGQSALYLLKPALRKPLSHKIKKNIACIKWLLSYNHEEIEYHDS